MTSTRRPRSTPLPLVTALSFGVVLVLWLWWSAHPTSNGFPPTPGRSIGRVFWEARAGDLWPDLWASTSRILVGFLISAVLALPLGIVAGRTRVGQAAIVPFTEFVRYMPVTAFLAFSIILFGLDEGQKWFLIWMGTFWQLVLMVADDAKRVPNELVDAGRTLGLSKLAIMRRIVLRSAAPRLWDSHRLALGWAWTWVVLAEQVNPKHGLGYAIDLGRKFNAYDKILGYLLVLGMVGLVTDQLLRFVGRRLFQHEQAAR